MFLYIPNVPKKASGGVKNLNLFGEKTIVFHHNICT